MKASSRQSIGLASNDKDDAASEDVEELQFVMVFY